MTVYCPECCYCKHGIFSDGEFKGCDNKYCKFEEKEESNGDSD